VIDNAVHVMRLATGEVEEKPSRRNPRRVTRGAAGAAPAGLRRQGEDAKAMGKDRLDGVGDVWTSPAIDADSKLIIASLGAAKHRVIGNPRACTGRSA